MLDVYKWTTTDLIKFVSITYYNHEVAKIFVYYERMIITSQGSKEIRIESGTKQVYHHGMIRWSRFSKYLEEDTRELVGVYV